MGRRTIIKSPNTPSNTPMASRLSVKMQVLRLNKTSEKKAFIKTLIDNGADITTVKNNKGKTALDIILERI